VAFARALTALDPDPEVRCPDHLAHELLRPEMRAALARPEAIREQLNARFPGSYPFHIARTKHTDALLSRELEQGVEQVVILGAGLDTRVFRFADRLALVRVFELDFPANQRQKLARLAPRALPGNVSYVPIDFTTQDLRSVLEGAGLEPARTTFFVWEGVSYYLDRGRVREVLEYVGRGGRGRRSIVLDYALRSFVEGDHSSYGSRQVAEYFSGQGEPFVFGLEVDEVAAFFRSCGLEPLSDLGPPELSALYATRKGEAPPPMVGLYRMAYAASSAQAHT
jgi:methyltransferase (TIGR00027 family)